MRKAAGYAFIYDTDTGRVIKERDTFTCHHCHALIHTLPNHDPVEFGGHCKVCDYLICPKCEYLKSIGKPCMPFEKAVGILDDHMEHGGKFYDPFHGND